MSSWQKTIQHRGSLGKTWNPGEFEIQGKQYQKSHLLMEEELGVGKEEEKEEVRRKVERHLFFYGIQLHLLPGCKSTSWGPQVPYSVYHTPTLAGNSLSDTLHLCVFTQSSGVLQSSQYDNPNVRHSCPLSSFELVWTHRALGPPSVLRPLNWGSTAFWALVGPWMVDRRLRSWEFITTWAKTLLNPFAHLHGSSLKDHLLVSPGFVIEVFHSPVLWVLFSIVLSKFPSIAF